MNLKVRLKQKWFWITLIPLLFLLVDQCVQVWTALQTISIGDALYGGPLMTLVLEVVGVVFAVLALIGFPVDLTTEGYGDSARALNYETPAPNASETAEIDFQNNMQRKTELAKHAKTCDDDDPGKVEMTD